MVLRPQAREALATALTTMMSSGRSRLCYSLRGFTRALVRLRQPRPARPSREAKSSHARGRTPQSAASTFPASAPCQRLPSPETVERGARSSPLTVGLSCKNRHCRARAAQRAWRSRNRCRCPLRCQCLPHAHRLHRCTGLQRNGRVCPCKGRLARPCRELCLNPRRERPRCRPRRPSQWDLPEGRLSVTLRGQMLLHSLNKRCRPAPAAPIVGGATFRAHSAARLPCRCQLPRTPLRRRRTFAWPSAKGSAGL
mmetsp:Transcript_25159/g.95088  ORF Transcript_25159/g.95088 Transcript_25159/m.95088 type:complete len:254 (+) Transcript_25159:901-1662(+)